MNADEQAIRDLVALWLRATAAGDVDTVLGLMGEDVVFLVAGQPPIRGRDAFERGLRGVLGQHRIESTGEVLEVEVSGSLAYCWTNLTVRVIPFSGGDATVRAGSRSPFCANSRMDRGSWRVTPTCCLRNRDAQCAHQAGLPGVWVPSLDLSGRF